MSQQPNLPHPVQSQTLKALLKWLSVLGHVVATASLFFFAPLLFAMFRAYFGDY